MAMSIYTKVNASYLQLTEDAAIKIFYLKNDQEIVWYMKLINPKTGWKFSFPLHYENGKLTLIKNRIDREVIDQFLLEARSPFT